MLKLNVALTGKLLFLSFFVLVLGGLLSCSPENAEVPPTEPTREREGATPTEPTREREGATPTVESPRISPDVDELQEPSQLEFLGRIGERVASIRGINLTQNGWKFTSITRDMFRESLEEDLSDEDTLANLESSEMFYKMVALIPQEASLKDIYRSFLGGGVLGYYDTDTKEFAVIQGSAVQDEWTSADESTFVHEFVHLLQDTRFDLGDIRPDDATTDYGLAVTSLIEGDARSIEADYEERFINGREGYLLPYADEQFLPLPDLESLEAFFSTPAIILFLELGPYNFGAEFARLLKQQGGLDAVDLAIQNPPDSTEQVLNFESYLADEQAADVYIDPKAFGDGWTVRSEDTLGQMFISGWLNVYAGANITMNNLLFRIPETALGWNGDYLVISENDSGEWGAAGLISWDTDNDADEFLLALNQTFQSGSLFSGISSGTSDVHLWQGPAGVVALSAFDHAEYGPVSAYVVSPSADGATGILDSLR